MEAIERIKNAVKAALRADVNTAPGRDVERAAARAALVAMNAMGTERSPSAKYVALTLWQAADETLRCHDCRALPGAEHAGGCDVQLCTVCGLQRISCPCGGSPHGWGQVWSGRWPGDAECRVRGLVSYDQQSGWRFDLNALSQRPGSAFPAFWLETNAVFREVRSYEDLCLVEDVLLSHGYDMMRDARQSTARTAEGLLPNYGTRREHTGRTLREMLEEAGAV